MSRPELKVGDRVRFIKAPYGRGQGVGLIGTITRADPERIIAYQVHVDGEPYDLDALAEWLEAVES